MCVFHCFFPRVSENCGGFLLTIFIRVVGCVLAWRFHGVSGT